MADFRKYALALAGAACFLGITGTASAQLGNGFNCTANAATPLDMRAEGLTEQAGDIVLNCTGGTPTAAGAVVPQVNITVSLNTQVTSRLIGAVGNGALTEALLLINEPAAGSQIVCPAGTTGLCTTTTTLGTGRGGGQGNGQYLGAVPDAYQGILVAANAVTFFGVAIDPPGTTSNTNGGTVSSLVLRITDIRANASALGAPTGFSSTSVLGSISTSVGFPITNPSLTIGNVRTGLLRGLYNGFTVTSPVVSGTTGTSSALTQAAFGSASTGGAPTLTQCTSNSLSSTSFSAALVEYVNFTEGFATATKLRNSLAGIAAQGNPGFISNAESQFFLNGLATSPSGTADFATRIKLTFGSLQAGVTVYVPTTVPSNNSGVVTTSADETLTLTATEGGTFSPVPASTVTNLPSGGSYGGFAPLTITSGSAVAVYEVTSQQTSAPSTIDSFSVPILVVYSASPATNSPGLGTSTVQVDFAPTSTVGVAAASPVPRFIQTSPLNNSFAIAACATNLLFPFVTNQAGFDTGLAIAASSQDPFGTALQSGTCTLNFYGSGAPAAFTTPTVTAGTVYTTLASSVAAGFQGYMIAQCKFQYGHGFAFITDGFGGPGRGLSQGYLALIIPDTSIQSRVAGVITSAQRSGEQLGN